MSAGALRVATIGVCAWALVVPAASPALDSGKGKPFAVGMRVLRLVDRTRTIRLPNGRVVPRTLVTLVRYPAAESRSGTDILDAPAASGPFPLIVFGHGFAVTPGIYAPLLRAWAAAGFVVAAPIFPLENANAPGGPNESDLSNQPGDMRFVIARLLAGSSARTGWLHGLLEPREIAVAGHSDGGETALVTAYDPANRDPRIRAAVILSGAQAPAGMTSVEAGSAALLATQGTADTVNPPAITDAFFRIAVRPKFLLRLLGSEHLPPYTVEQPQLRVVERVTIAFLRRYLDGGGLKALLRSGVAPGIASLVADP